MPRTPVLFIVLIFNGENLSDLELDRKNRAKQLIEDFTVTANGVPRPASDRRNFLPSAESFHPRNAGTGSRSSRLVSETGCPTSRMPRPSKASSPGDARLIRR